MSFRFDQVDRIADCGCVTYVVHTAEMEPQRLQDRFEPSRDSNGRADAVTDLAEA